MKNKLWIFGSVILLVASQIAAAQPPAGSTGQCKDGTYTDVAKKAGACSGHKGVQTWFATSEPSPAPSAATSTKSAAPAPAAAPEAKSAATPAPASASTSSSSSMTTQAPAPGGGPGMVWVNLSSKVYHCQGTRYYGTTKDGKYMSEADALKMGAHADHGKACSK